MNSYFHILNPNDQNRPAVHAFFEAHSDLPRVWVERSSHPTHLETIIQWAMLEGHHDLALWSGDGSFSRAVEELYKSGSLGKTNLALIPVGTSNDLSRKLETGSWKEAARKLLDGLFSTRAMDLGFMKSGMIERTFVNNAGFGRTPASRAKHRPNPLRDILNFTRKKLEIQYGWDHQKGQLACEAFLGIVFNAPYFSKGLYFSKDADPFDGTLTAFIEPPQSKWRLLIKFLRARGGAPLADANTKKIEGARIEIMSDGELFPQADGEAVGENPVFEITYTVLKNAVKIAIFKS